MDNWLEQFCNDHWLAVRWAQRANLSAMTDKQLLELADFLRPHIDDLAVFRVWFDALLATKEN